MRIVIFTSSNSALNSWFYSLLKRFVSDTSTSSPSSPSSWTPHNIVDKQKAFNLMLAFYRVIYEVVMIEIKWLMEKFNQDLLLCYIVMPRQCCWALLIKSFFDGIYCVFHLILRNATSFSVSMRMAKRSIILAANTHTHAIVCWRCRVEKVMRLCMFDGNHK